MVLVADLDYLLDILFRKDLASRVSWVDNDDAFKVDIILLRLLNLLLYIFHIKGPVLLLIKIVRYQSASIKSDQC